MAEEKRESERKYSEESEERRASSEKILEEYNILDVRRMCRHIHHHLNETYDDYVKKPSKQETPLCTYRY